MEARHFEAAGEILQKGIVGEILARDFEESCTKKTTKEELEILRGNRYQGFQKEGNEKKNEEEKKELIQKNAAVLLLQTWNKTSVLDVRIRSKIYKSKQFPTRGKSRTTQFR